MHKTHAQLRDGVIQSLLFLGRQIALRFFLQHGEKVDVKWTPSVGQKNGRP